jgi:hypothetical protein
MAAASLAADFLGVCAAENRSKDVKDDKDDKDGKDNKRPDRVFSSCL